MTFDKFKGMQKERKIKVRKKTVLESLISAEAKIIDLLPDAGLRHKEYGEAYAVLKDDLLRKIAFDEDDLRTYVLSRTDLEYEPKKTYVRGMYSGCLLQLLNERAGRGERTIFHIDGHGGRFDYLFQYAGTIDEVIVDNFKGDHICQSIASHKGSANRIVLKNIKGNLIGPEIAHYGGKVKSIIVLDCEGDNILNSLCDPDGRVKQVVAVRLNGESALLDVGNHGHISQLIGVSIQGDNPFYTIAEHGKIKQVIAVDLDGAQALNWIGYDSEISSLLYSNVPQIGEYISADNIICEEKIDKNDWRKQHILKKFELVRSMKDKNYEEISRIAEVLK